VRATSHQILARVPEAAVEALTDSAPSICDPNHPMVGILRANAVALVRPAAASIGRLGGTAARVWRQRGIPACGYGRCFTSVDLMVGVVSHMLPPGGRV